jgi:hypothetical protein
MGNDRLADGLGMRRDEPRLRSGASSDLPDNGMLPPVWYLAKRMARAILHYASQHGASMEGDMDKAVIDAIREKEQLPDSMTDSEIAHEYKGTYTAARAAVSLDHKPLDQVLADTMGKIFPFMKRKK